MSAAEAFQFLSKLQYVSFDSNALTFVILESLSRVLWDTSDVLIDLSSNPLHCVYSLEWYKVYNENNIKWTSGNACLLTCNTPTQWRGWGPLSTFTQRTAECRIHENQMGYKVLQTCMQVQQSNFSAGRLARRLSLWLCSIQHAWPEMDHGKTSRSRRKEK